MLLVIQIRNSRDFQLLYASKGFTEGLDVIGYLIYPNLTKSDILTFSELGDGIYAVSVPYKRQTEELDEKYGVVVKENGETKHFEIIRMIN